MIHHHFQRATGTVHQWVVRQSALPIPQWSYPPVPGFWADWRSGCHRNRQNRCSFQIHPFRGRWSDPSFSASVGLSSAPAVPGVRPHGTWVGFGCAEVQSRRYRGIDLHTLSRHGHWHLRSYAAAFQRFPHCADRSPSNGISAPEHRLPHLCGWLLPPRSPHRCLRPGYGRHKYRRRASSPWQARPAPLSWHRPRARR